MTGDLSLRALHSDDTAFLRRLALDPQVVRYIGDGTPWTEDHLQHRMADALDQTSSTTWQIATDSEGIEVGLLSMVAHPDGIEIGYWVDPAEWGRGHARRLIEHALTAHPINRPRVARVHPENTASRRALDRAGFHATPAQQDGPTALVVYQREPEASRSAHAQQ